MKKFYSLVLLTGLFALTSLGQGLIPSTVGQVYNFEVGDSFEYVFHWVDDTWYKYSEGYSLVVITGKVASTDTVMYSFSQITEYTAHEPPGGYPQFWGPLTGNAIDGLTGAANYCQPRLFPTYKFFNLDSPVLSRAFYPDTVCLLTNPCLDTAFVSGQYESRKLNWHRGIGFNNVDETFGDSIGLIKGFYYNESFHVGLWDSLIYYRKANGQHWGQLRSLFLGLNDFTNNSIAFRISPNPFSNQLTFSLADNEQTTVLLYDFLGQQVLQQTFTTLATVNTAQLADGIYFYELRSNKGTLKTGKLVKQ